MVLTTNSTYAKLRFFDAQVFVVCGMLKAFAKEFGGIDDGDKGVFSYGTITKANYNEILSTT